MADPRTKEELLQEIENTASENDSYKKFKESLTDLNHNIDELMKPGKEGWKLLDSDTFVPLYEKYLKTAKHLSNFLHETKDSTKKEDKVLWDVCNAFRHFFAGDMDTMRKYRSEMEENPMSLPSLFEEARVHTVSLNNKNVDVRGGANSSRMAMKVTKKSGSEMDGFFTKAVYNDPLSDVQSALNKAAGQARKKEEKALLTSFSDVFKAYCRTKGIGEDKEPETLYKVLDAVGEVARNNTPVSNVPKFFNLYSQMLDKIGAQKASEITGFPIGQVPASEFEMKMIFGRNTQTEIAIEVGKAWNTSLNMRATEIAPKSRLDTRNVAMSNVAHLLGMDGIVCEARMMKLKDKDGNVVDGIFMEKARGVDPNSPGSKYSAVNGNQLQQGDRHCLKQLADLQVLDYICGNPDRHGGNLFFEFNEDGQLIGIQGIDNDLSFGGLKTTRGNVGFLMAPEHMGAISKGTADRILALDSEEFAYALYGILDKKEVEAAQFRLENMKTAITVSREKVADYKKTHPKLDQKGINISYGPKGALREIEDKDWSRVRMDKLLSQKHGAKNIFVEATETLDDFGRFSRKPVDEVDYASTETVNRAEEAGVISRLNMTKELRSQLKWKSADTPESYEDVAKALKEHENLLSKIATRMEDCKKKVKNDTAETGEYFDQYVTKDDLEKIRKSEEKIRDSVTKYYSDRNVVPGKEDNVAGNALTRREVGSVADIHAFIKDAKERTPEEEATLKANHRKAVEEVARAIAKNPDSPAAGPKFPRNPAKKVNTVNHPVKKTGRTK